MGKKRKPILIFSNTGAELQEAANLWYSWSSQEGLQYRIQEQTWVQSHWIRCLWLPKLHVPTNQVPSPDYMYTTSDINDGDAQTLTGFLGSNVLPSEPTTDGWWSRHTGVSQASGYSLATGIHHSGLPAVHGTATMMSLGRQVCGHTGLILREKAKRHWYTRHPRNPHFTFSEPFWLSSGWHLREIKWEGPQNRS